MPNTLHASLPRCSALAAIVALVTAAACNDGGPEEIRTTANTFPQTASWSAAASPVGTSTVRGTLAAKQFAGNRISATMTLNGAPNTTYQWRFYRDPCSSNTAAQFAYSATGVTQFSTSQSYTDIRTDASGVGTATSTVSGTLDSLTNYSVRVRVGLTTIGWNGINPVSCGDMKRTPGAG